MRDGRAQIKMPGEVARGLKGLGRVLRVLRPWIALRALIRREDERQNREICTVRVLRQWGRQGTLEDVQDRTSQNIHNGSRDCPTRCSGDVSEPSSVEHSQPDLQARSTVRSLNHIKPNWWCKVQTNVQKKATNSIRQTLDSLVPLRTALTSANEKETKRPRDQLALAMFSVKRVSAEVIEWN
ncbi:hypothetical protein B0H11DRAFT_2195072 [Mycena galericulata]|nr:hypothetical protein B0H11DRAFT_2195072 [Mycena galericulata]